MSTLTIENVPKEILKRFGKNVDFGEVKLIKRRLPKKDLTIELERLSNDPDNTSYGPFSTMEEFLEHLHSNKD